MPIREVPEKFLIAFSLAGEQRNLVRSIAEAVEEELGPATVFLDEWFEHFIAGHDGDLKLQQIYGKQSELVVICVSERYGSKPWTRAEHEAIRARLMETRASPEKRDELRILPIRVGEGEVEGILFNTIVPDVCTRSASETAKLILDRLRLILPSSDHRSPIASDWPEEPPRLLWPMADHSEVRAAFERLLTRAVPWRFMPLRGPSESGKSHITRQMLSNALRLPGLACGRFDFKGIIDMDAEVRAFVQDLEVPLPPVGPGLNERLGHILGGLKRRARPALLVFDTYESAGETEDWVEKQLLPSLIRATWLRVVIAGQRVPERTGAIWGEDASPLITLKPPPAPDWFNYGQKHHPELTLAEVETACRLARDRASLLAQLLGPKS
jgi:TIR domain